MKLKTLLCSAAALVGLTVPLAASADGEQTPTPITAVNPVTGETETYVYKYVGSGTWTAADWQNAAGEEPPAVPQVAAAQEGDDTCFDSLLVNGEQSLSASIEGWAFNIGLFGGAELAVPTLTKWQGGCSVRVGSGSKLTISALGSGTYGNSIDFYVAEQDGITYACDYGKAGSFNYYFAGNGSVSYQNLTGGNHTIKAADIILTAPAEKTLESKTLVSFSNQPNFNLDAGVTLKDAQETVIDTVYFLGSVTATTPTITTEDPVGTCQFVKSASGIVLYYVDGDPAEYVAKSYTPSINVNFTYGTDNVLTTKADIGLVGYAVPGTSWNQIPLSENIQEGEGVLSEVKEVSADGSAEVLAGTTVTITGARGSYSCWGLSADTDPRNGYIDEGNDDTTPTVTITNVPYDYYRVIVYCATDTNNGKFGYVSINGEDFTYDSGALKLGATSWGDTGGQGTARPIEVGINTVVSDVMSGSTATIVGHRMSTSERGCVAAIQIVKVEMDADLVITVNGDTNYTVSENTEVGSVKVIGSGTLTFEGEGTITASSLDISDFVTVNMAGITPTTVTGTGTVAYDGVVPPTGKGWTDSDNWSGTVWIKNVSGITGNNNATTGVQPNSLGNSNSKVQFSGVSGWLEAPVTYDPEIVLENDTYDYALKLTNGNSPANNNNNDNRCTVIKKLSGSGTLGCGGSSYAWPLLKVWDANDFTGSIDTSNADGNGQGKTGLIVVFCAEDTEFADTLYNLFNDKGSDSYPHPHTICVASGTTVTQASTATWTAVSGFKVEGTLNVNGTLASSAATAISGSGTVVFNNRLPTPTGDAWWKNANWTGAVQIKDVTNLVGASNASGTYIDFNQYGNAGSIVELNNVTGWINASYTCTPKLKVTGTLYLNNGYSGAANAFKVGTLLGSGAISGDGSADKVVFNVTEDASGFTGTIGLNNKCIVFGSTIPDALTAGTIYVTEGAVATMQQASGTWWAVSGIKVDGTLKATGRDKWGGGTAVTLGDTGVLELTSTANAEDYSDYSTVTGTGTIKYSSTAGWRTFPSDDAKMPATTLTVQVELADSLIITKNNNGTTTIGNLAGSKNIRSDWNATSGGAANARTLTVTQSKDTEWSGKFVSNRITQFNVGGTGGTLTLSGTQDVTIPATISGSVNLTGTWVGATTVSGTFGGTGTLTGDLTFAEGSTFKVWESDINGLAVSGTITYPENGTVTVDVSDIETTGGNLVILTASDANVTVDATKFALADGTEEGYSLSVNEAGNLVLTAPAAVGAIAPTNDPTAYTIYQTADQVIAALAQLSGMQTLTVTGAFAADSVTVQSGLTLTVSVMGGSVSVGTFNVAGSLILTANSVSSTSVVLTDAAASCTVNSTLVGSVNVTSGVTGKDISTSEDTNPVYTLVDASATSITIDGVYGCNFKVDAATQAEITDAFGVATTDENFAQAAIAYVVGGTLDGDKVVIPPPTITVSGTTVTVTFTSTNAKINDYEITVKLQKAAGLASPMVWADVDSEVMSSASTSLTDTVTANDTSNFYQVVVTVADKSIVE